MLPSVAALEIYAIKQQMKALEDTNCKWLQIIYKDTKYDSLLGSMIISYIGENQVIK